MPCDTSLNEYVNEEKDNTVNETESVKVGDDDPTREKIVALLREGLCEVVFVKKNGEVRTMFATLETSRLPPINPSETGAKKLVLDSAAARDQIRVFDIESKGWRSFTLSSLVSITTAYDDDDDTVVYMREALMR